MGWKFGKFFLSLTQFAKENPIKSSFLNPPPKYPKNPFPKVKVEKEEYLGDKKMFLGKNFPCFKGPKLG